MKGFQLSGSQQFVGSVLLRLAEGRQPWSSSSLTVRPQQELADAESGIWALAAPQTPGGLILGGTEEGMVMAWDLRMSSPAWQVLLVVWCLWHSLQPCWHQHLAPNLAAMLEHQVPTLHEYRQFSLSLADMFI